MSIRKFALGLGVAACLCGPLAGCGEQGASNIPEEKVITKESSDDMAKKLEEGRKAMNAAGKK
ncbi:hypothetical protein [Paludisphaera sp.]|uniref:hypothetical protein n=1 Tax=Paludisphaera sp. TaxID=2017432 RepID=UPI00301DAE19